LLVSLVQHGLPRRYAPRNDGEYTMFGIDLTLVKPGIPSAGLVVVSA